MEFVPRFGGRPLKIETFTEPGQGASAGIVEGLSLPHDRLEAIGQKGADGPSFFGSHHSCFSQ
ncbi:MAG TPA: hypothetical protein VGK32_03860 [Vicinamibacterales bacterium]|jgi:hypothetical protein